MLLPCLLQSYWICTDGHRCCCPVYCNHIESALMLLCNICLYGTDVGGQLFLVPQCLHQKYQGCNSIIGTGCHSNQDQASKTKIKFWALNLSSKPLSTAQEIVLAHGPNFTVTPKTPYQEYIRAVEVASQSLKPTEAEEFRSDIARVLKQARPSKSNISKEEWKAIKELRTDKECLILTADKGVALVVMDKKD